jgi:hypothetical protein
MEICHYNFHNLEICNRCVTERWVPPQSLTCGSQWHMVIGKNERDRLMGLIGYCYRPYYYDCFASPSVL